MKRSAWAAPLIALLALLFGFNADLNAAVDDFCDNLGCASISKFSANIDSQLQGKVVGYVSIVGGKTVEYGTARTNVDPPSRKMSTEVPINVASVSKVLTTIAVLQSLARHHLTIESKIASFLPPDWIQGPNVGTITFHQLLTHSAGFRGGDTGYEGLRQQIQAGVQLADKKKAVYNNLNFAIFRVLLPYMEGFSDPDQRLAPRRPPTSTSATCRCMFSGPLELRMPTASQPTAIRRSIIGFLQARPMAWRLAIGLSSVVAADGC